VSSRSRHAGARKREVARPVPEAAPRRNNARRWFYPAVAVWLVLLYLSASNVDMTPPKVPNDRWQEYGKTMSFLPAPDGLVKPLALAQPVLGFPLRNVLRAAADRLWANPPGAPISWANYLVGFCFPFRARDIHNYRADLVFFTFLNVSIQLLLLFAAVLLVKRLRRGD